ncbi:hypothetical protein ACFSE1_00025, partial [Rhizobium helianthi]
MSDDQQASPASTSGNVQFNGYMRVDPLTGTLAPAAQPRQNRAQIQKPTAPSPAPPELIPD